MGGGFTGGTIWMPLPTGMNIPAPAVGCFVTAAEPALMAAELAKVFNAISTYLCRYRYGENGT